MRRASLVICVGLMLIGPAVRADPPLRATTGTATQPALGLDAEVLRLHRLGRFAEALPLAEQVVRLREAVLGPNDPGVAQSLNNLAEVFRAMGQYERAVPLHERALRIREVALGTNHPDVAQSLNNLAVVFVTMGQYERAVPLYERAHHIWEVAFGPTDPGVAQSLNNLAEVFHAMGQYERALPLLERALRIRETALGPDHPDVAQSLNNLAEVFRAMGQFDRAVPLHERALRIRETALGPDHPDVAQSLNSSALVFHEMGQDERAVSFLERALRILEAALGPNHPNMARNLNNLAAVLHVMGQDERVVPLLERALRILEVALGPNHPDVAASLNNLAVLFYAMGQYERAVPLLERALHIREAALGPNHPDVAMSFNNLAAVFHAMGQYERAMLFYERALRSLATRIQGIASHQREEGLQQFLRSTQGNADALISVALEHRDDTRVCQLALQATLLFKARSEEESVATLATLRRSNAPEDRALLAEWSTAQQRRIAANSGRTPPAERAQAEAELLAVEERFARRSTALRERRELNEVDALIPRLAQRLAPGAALVELVSFLPFHAGARTLQESWGAAHYAAFVLHPDGTHALVDLGEAAPLDALAQQLTTLVHDPQRTPESIAHAGQSLEQRLFAPIAPLLHPGTHRLLLAPDGPLHLTPLHLMHDGHRWLADRYTVSYVTSGRDLLRQRSELDVPSEPAALAVTRYAVPAWNLPGLTTQADLLPRLVPGIRVLRDEAATESALRDLAAPRVLHIAAHGQFLDDAARTAMQRGRLVLADATPSLATREDGNDGLATAAELLTMNLRGTRLVVLSACETAQGSAAVGQGVFGLRRAFLLAGAEALVTTQWDVDERAGAVFTVALYEGLRAGMRSADAVARAARVVRERDPDPFAWAPFVLIGRDDVIDWDAPVQPAPATSVREPGTRTTGAFAPMEVLDDVAAP